MLQFLLLLGLPLGQFVLGGHYTVIPLHLRWINLVSFVLWGFFGTVYLACGHIIKGPWRENYLKNLLFITTIFLALASIFNCFITSSVFEKYFTGGLSTLTFFLSLSLLLLKAKEN
nr:hypothetical protein [Streptococcus oricebi]